MRELQAALERGFSWATTLQDKFKELLHLKNTDNLTPQIVEKHHKDISKQLQIIQKELDESEEPHTKIRQKTKALINRMNQHLINS